MEPDMPASDTFSSFKPQPSQHWYSRLPSKPPRRRRYSSSVINNMWNAWSNWDNAMQGNPAGLLATMRTQINNIKQMIDASALDTQQKPLVQQLIAETKQALDTLNPALLSQQTNRASSRLTLMQRTASEQSAISSNAKAALGCMAYLQDDNLFPGCGDTYQYIQERLEQIFRLMDGEYQIGDIEGVRQQLALAPQQPAPMVLNPDGTMTPYTPPASGSTALNTPQPPSGAQAQGYAPMTTEALSASSAGQMPAPSPVAGLEAKLPSWDGTSNTTSEGEETVGTGQDWFSLYGTTIEKFGARCSNWMRQSGGGQDALIAHLRQSGVPDNVIGQTMPYLQ